MEGIKIELLKIVKSRYSLVGLFLLLVYPLIVISFIRVRGFEDKTALDITVYMIATLADTFAIYIVCAMISSLIFAGEFQYKTLRYILIRPISLVKFFFSKVVAVWLYVVTVYLAAVLLCLLVNSLLWEFMPLHGKDQVILNNALLRVALLAGTALVIVLFQISVTTLLSILLKNQISVLVTTIIFYLIIYFMGFIFPMSNSLLPINLRTSYLQPIGEEQINMLTILPKYLILLCESLVIFFISYTIIKRSNITV